MLLQCFCLYCAFELTTKNLTCRIIHAWPKKTSQREEPFSLQFSSFFLHASVSSLLIKSLWLNIYVCRLLACMLASSYLAEVESRTQGSRPRPRTQKNPRPRPRTAFPRTDTLEAKDRNARGQGQGPRTQAQMLSKKEKKVFTKIFQAISTKNVFQKIFQALHKILTIQKVVMFSSRGQANF